VLGDGGVAAAQPKQMRAARFRDEALDGGGGRASTFAHQAVRRWQWSVVGVVVDVDDRRLPLGEFAAGGRQRLQRCAIDGLEGALTRALEFLERPPIEIGEQGTDSGVELFE
jgi:hypothetical protein